MTDAGADASQDRPRLGDVADPDVSAGDLPADRKQRTPGGDWAHADASTLIRELAVVAQRHEGPLSKAAIVQTLFDFADSYANVFDVDVDVQMHDHPTQGGVALLYFPDDDGLAPAPVGAWNPEEDDLDIDGVDLMDDNRLAIDRSPIGRGGQGGGA